MSDWKTASFLAPKCVPHKVNDETLNFYAITVDMAIRVRALGGELAEALTVIFEGRQTDVTQTVREVPDEFGVGRETIIQEISPTLAEFRGAQRSKAVRKALEALLDPSNAAIVGEILMNSLREMFPPGDPGNPPGKEFISRLPVPVLGQMIGGLVKANAGVFGPFEERAQKLGKVIVQRLEEGASNGDPENPGDG